MPISCKEEVLLEAISILLAKALKPAFVSAKADVMPEKGCERPNPCRVAGGSGAIQQQVPLKVMGFLFQVPGWTGVSQGLFMNECKREDLSR